MWPINKKTYNKTYNKTYKTRMSLGLRSQVNMGTEGQGYGDWTNTHDNRAIGRAFFLEHANVKSSALRRKMTELWRYENFCITILMIVDELNINYELILSKIL